MHPTLIIFYKKTKQKKQNDDTTMTRQLYKDDTALTLKLEERVTRCCRQLGGLQSQDLLQKVGEHAKGDGNTLER